MYNFEFSNWPVIPTGILAGALIILAFYFYKTARKRQAVDNNTVLVANSARMRNTSAYQAAIKKLWVMILTAFIIAAEIAAVSVFALAKPTAVSIDRPEKHNRDISLCLDASGSMFDVNIKILDKFQEMIKDFGGERISLTIFNATSMQVFPLTDDYDYIAANLAKVEQVFTTNYDDPETATYLASTLGREEGASLIGDGLYSCALTFDNKENTKRSRSIIFATDNVVNGKELVPLDEAAQIATDMNIRVYGINPGTRGEGIMHVPDSSLESMQAASEQTGGKFFQLKDSNATATIVEEISQTETSKVEGSAMVIKKDSPEILLGALSVLFTVFMGFVLWRKL